MTHPNGQSASFSRGALAHLQLALGTTLRSRHDDETALRGALDRLCGEARAMGLGLEEMLAVVNALWLPVAAGSQMTDEHKRTVCDRVVSACTATYRRAREHG
jgi:hypothetical protein